MPLALRIAAFLRARFQAARHPRHAHRQMRAANAMLPARSLVVKPNLPEALARKRESGPAMLLELVILPAMNTALRTPKIIVATVHFVIACPTQTTPKVSFVWSGRSGIVPSLDNGGPEACRNAPLPAPLAVQPGLLSGRSSESLSPGPPPGT